MRHEADIRADQRARVCVCACVYIVRGQSIVSCNGTSVWYSLSFYSFGEMGCFVAHVDNYRNFFCRDEEKGFHIRPR